MILQHHLGTELFWWRETGRFHTLVTLYAGFYDVDEDMQYVAVLLDQSGKRVTEWSYSANSREPVFIDSREYAHFGVQDGVLAIFVGTVNRPSEFLQEHYARLYGCIDWFSDKGDICTLHSDQSFRPRDQGIATTMELTEIIVDPGIDISNYLVVINCLTEQPEGAINLILQNHSGEELTSAYNRKMAPLSLHKIYLDSLFPAIREFAQGKRVSVKGTISFNTGHYCRPYVVSESDFMCAYHGGNLYDDMEALSQHDVRNRKDMPGNPFFAIHNARISTRLNLFNSHGADADDLWVDLRIFDSAGNLSVSTENAIFVKRGRFTVVDLADFLPGDCDEFIGHVALNYHRDPDKTITGVQQCLAEYHTRCSTARVMFWSDVWNSSQRQAHQVAYKSYQRAWVADGRTTYFAIVNNSIHLDYKLKADYVVRVIGINGRELTFPRCVDPQATDYFCLADLDPHISEIFAGQSVVLVLIETQRDLANIQLTFCEPYGTCAAEHTMAMQTMQDGKVYGCTGA